LLQAFRSKTLNAFVDSFKEDPDSALPHLQILLSAPARTIATAFQVNRVESTDTIAEVVKTLSENDTVVISGNEDAADELLRFDVLLGSKPFFYKAITCVDFDQPVSTVINDIQELPTMHNSCFLNEVLRVMCVSHVSTVGIYDDSFSIIAIIRFSDIFNAVLKEISELHSVNKRADATETMRDLDEEDGNDDTGGGLAACFYSPLIDVRVCLVYPSPLILEAIRVYNYSLGGTGREGGIVTIEIAQESVLVARPFT